MEVHGCDAWLTEWLGPTVATYLGNPSNQSIITRKFP